MDDNDLKFQHAVMEGLVPKVANSAVAVAVVPSDEEHFVDAKFCIELGVMIMLDKPIFAIVNPGAKVPEKLRLVADEIVEADLSNAEGQERLQSAIHAFMERFV